MPKPTDPYLLHSVFPGIFPHPKEIEPMSQQIDISDLEERVESGFGINHHQAKHLLKMLRDATPRSNPMTYADHLAEAERAASSIDNDNANPLVQAAIAQAHACTAIAMLLEELLGTIDAEKPERPYTTVRIIGGLGNPIAH